MLIILDWDGTLADSRALIVGAMQQAAISLDLPAPADETVAALIGLGLPETVAALFPGQSSPVQVQVKEAYSRHFVERSVAQGKTQFFPGVLSSLQALKERGHELAIATGKSRKGLNRVLSADGITNLFQATRAADETRSKPHPQMLLELLEETGFGTEQAIMVGDTSYDMEMAAQIDMQRVAVSYGVHSVDILQQYQPALTINQFDELLQWSMLN